MGDWTTNDPEAAKALKDADRRYDAARRKASALPLAKKIEALRTAREARDAAYQAIMQPPAPVAPARRPGDGPEGIDELAADIGWSGAYAFHNID